MCNEILKPIQTDVTALGEVFYKEKKPYQLFKVPCSRCGGSGEYSYNEVDGTMCLKCKGGKYFREERRVYTEKELKSIEARKEKLQLKKEEEFKAGESERLAKNNLRTKRDRGFWQDTVYVVDMKNSFGIKESLKLNGARWNQFFQKYYFENDNLKDQYPLLKVNYYDMVTLVDGTYDWNTEKLYAMQDSDSVTQKITANKINEHFGNVGDKVELKITILKVASYETKFYPFHTAYINSMISESGNVFIWSTGKCLGSTGDKMTIKGTIKGHSEYGNDKQTELIRCKVI